MIEKNDVRRRHSIVGLVLDSLIGEGIGCLVMSIVGLVAFLLFTIVSWILST